MCYPNTLACFECQTEILPLQNKKRRIYKLNPLNHLIPYITDTRHTSHLVLQSKSAVRDVRGEVAVVDRTECKTIDPAAAEVGDVNVLTNKGERDSVEMHDAMVKVEYNKIIEINNITSFFYTYFKSTFAIKTSPSSETCKHVQDHLIALGLALTPAEQRVSFRASMTTQQQVETILGPEKKQETNC